MLWEGREFSEVENKGDQMLNRFILIKISTTSKGNSDFSKLTELIMFQLILERNRMWGVATT